MPRSFSVDLRQFTLGRPIGNDGTVVERQIGVTDVISVLIDEGFSDFSEPRVYHRMHGHDRENIRDQILDKLVGVPRDAYVVITRSGKDKVHLLISFEY